MKNLLPIYSKYIAKEFVLSFTVCFFFFFFIFFANQILYLAEHILSKKIPVLTVLLLLIYFMPAMISLSFPFASLVGCLMAASRLSSDNEILAMQASGINHFQIFKPFIIFGIILSLMSFGINDYLLPAGTVNYTMLYRKLIFSNPELELESYSVKSYLDTVIVTGKVEGKTIDDITIFDRTHDGSKRIITAENALLQEDKENRGIISLELNNVFSHYTDQKKELDYSYFTADKMIYNILLSDLSIAVRNPGPREMSSVDVYYSIREKEKTLNEKAASMQTLNDSNYYLFTRNLLSLSSAELMGDKAKNLIDSMKKSYNLYLSAKPGQIKDRTLQIYKLEFNKKFSLPSACLFFVIFAFPAGLFSRRSGKSVGFGLGLIVSVLYWLMLFAGHTLGIRSSFNPFISMWFPNFIILAAGITAFIIRFRK